MNSLLLNSFDDMSEDSLQLECVYQGHLIDLADADFMLEMVDFKEKQDLERSRLKVYSENGTDDDLQALYEQVFLESETTKKGIFSKVWEAIKDLFKSIRDSISKLIGGTNSIDKIAVDKDRFEATKKSTARLGGVLKTIAKLLAVLGIGAATVAGGKAVYDKVQANKATDQLKICQNDIVDVKKQLESCKVSGILPDKNIIYVAPSEFNNVSKEIDALAKEGENLASGVMDKAANASEDELKVIKPVADMLRGVADASKTMTQAQLNARQRTLEMLKNGQDKQAANNLERKGGDVNKTNARIDKDENKYDYQQTYAKAHKAGQDHLEKESAEDETTGDPTFEAGSLEDIMTLIADL